jgi:hypothetical protein
MEQILLNSGNFFDPSDPIISKFFMGFNVEDYKTIIVDEIMNSESHDNDPFNFSSFIKSKEFLKVRRCPCLSERWTLKNPCNDCMQYFTIVTFKPLFSETLIDAAKRTNIHKNKLSLLWKWLIDQQFNLFYANGIDAFDEYKQWPRIKYEDLNNSKRNVSILYTNEKDETKKRIYLIHYHTVVNLILVYDLLGSIPIFVKM